MLNCVSACSAFVRTHDMASITYFQYQRRASAGSLEAPAWQQRQSPAHRCVTQRQGTVRRGGAGHHQRHQGRKHALLRHEVCFPASFQFLHLPLCAARVAPKPATHARDLISSHDRCLHVLACGRAAIAAGRPVALTVATVCTVSCRRFKNRIRSPQVQEAQAGHPGSTSAGCEIFVV